MQQVLAMQQCSPTGLWQAPSTSCGNSFSVRAQASASASRAVLQLASMVRTQGFNSCSDRFRVSLRGGGQRCWSVSNSQAGRNTEELQVYLVASSC